MKNVFPSILIWFKCIEYFKIIGMYLIFPIIPVTKASAT